MLASFVILYNRFYGNFLNCSTDNNTPMKSFAQYVEEMRHHNPMPIPPEIRKIHQAFKDADKKLYVVGGAVRDHLLGKTPKDFDLATDAHPDQVQWILDTAGIKRTETVGQRLANPPRNLG
jgi:uncharacterized short protein YbdD (DUF466 family)